MEFKRFDGQKVDLVPYVEGYCNTHDNIFIMVATDSQCKGGKTYFGTVVALYDEGDGEHGHGAHVISREWNTRRYKKTEIFERMMAETEASIEVAKYMKNYGITDEGDGSNVAFAPARGWVEAEGFECRWKTLCPLATSTADKVARK